MFKIKYLDKATNTIEEKIYNTNNEDRALELYRRDISINSAGYAIKEIINLEELELQKAYEQMKDNTVNEAVKQIQKIIKSLIKKPYNSKNEMVYKVVEVKNNVIDRVKKEIEKIADPANWENGYIAEGKIEINIISKTIQLHATREYFLQAD
jgi:hypothetical protein